MHLFFMHCSLCLFHISLLDKVYWWLFQAGFFSFGRQKKWLLVLLGRWSPYTVTIAWEFAWADSALVVLHKWSSYRGSRLNSFHCNDVSQQHLNFSSKAISKIISKAEAKIILFATAVPWQSSEVISAMLFYLINHYKTIINCSAKPVNNSKQFKNICKW